MPPADAAPALRGLTVPDLARRYRVGRHTVRGWIARGELRATNTAPALCGRPRWIITPEALAEWEQRRAAGPTPRPARRRRRTALVDYYPD
jgi:transposase